MVHALFRPVGAAVGAAALIALSACGNASQKVSNDRQPDARASTEGATVQYPSPISPTPGNDSTNLKYARLHVPSNVNPAQDMPPEDLEVTPGTNAIVGAH
jgi:hypothetical protein